MNTGSSAISPVTVFVVSHTHWDREWYETFQQFRLKLVDLVDQVLNLLENEPGYEFFMLDGQAIVLEDYLAIRPEREADLRRLVQAGRLLVGPWYVLPDEFLVSPEAIIRNLQRGLRVSRRFGEPMMIGYIPDPFGHIGQMPQILHGFGISAAMLTRGLGDEPVELRWQAPDGSIVLLVYLRAGGYGNFAWFPKRPDLFVADLADRVREYLTGAATPEALLLNGVDHLFPQPELPQLLAAAREALPAWTIRHAALPDYIAAVRASLAADDRALPLVVGELRSPQRFHLLPAVLSTRMWIKRANDAAETLLERYAEPLSAWGHLLGGPDRSAQLDEAWHLLLENHPHDSICGCSIDQVHEEMRPRFAEVMQIGEALMGEGLNRLAAAVNLPPEERGSEGVGEQPVPSGHFAAQVEPWPREERAVVVFNPTPAGHTGRVEVEVRLPGPPQAVEVVAEEGSRMPAEWLVRPETFQGERAVDGDEFRRLLASARVGHFNFRRIRNLRLRIDGEAAELDILLRDDERAPDLTSIRATLDRIEAEAPLDAVTEARVRTHSMATGRLAFVARAVPGHGYQTFRLLPARERRRGGAEGRVSDSPSNVIENEVFRVGADRATGTLVLEDKRTGRVLRGLNQLVDGGDAGDQYSYSPPAGDRQILAPAQVATVQVERSTVEQALTMRYSLAVPAGLAPDRQARSEAITPLAVIVTARLVPGVTRLDITTEVENRATDHRLRAHFPLEGAERAWAEAHFDVVPRPTVVPPSQSTWAEDPPATFPQRGWTAIETGAGEGLLVAARGLPEVETTPDTNGGLAIKLTLLRCVGDLSRDDLRTRRGHAGPTFATPGAQCLGSHRFEVSVVPYSGGWLTIVPEANAFRAPLVAASRPLAAGSLPPGAQFLSIEPGEVALSVVKPPEDRSPGVIVRLWNPSSRLLPTRVRPLWPLVSASRTDLREQPGEPLALQENCVTLDLRPKEVVTLRLEFAEPALRV